MYRMSSRVSYSMIDERGKLSIPSVVNFFQDCCLFHSNDVGLTIPVIQKRHKAWLISSWHVVFTRRPVMGEEINVLTWAYEFKTIYGRRNFIMETKNNETLAYADSHWFLFDSEIGRPIRPDEQEIRAFGIEEKYDMEYLPRRILLPDRESEVDQTTVFQNQLDTNHHMNNGEYVRIACRYLPDDYPVAELRVEYKNAAHKGDKVTVYSAETTTHFYIILRNEFGELCAVSEFKKGKNYESL